WRLDCSNKEAITLWAGLALGKEALVRI
ncbi:MAG: hypothetical protein RL614_1035, partial [Pseudomonadota bacterium]